MVVSAIKQQQLSTVREICPEAPFVIPGVGAQGSGLEAAVLQGADAGGRLAIINSSRDVIYASQGPDFTADARYVATKSGTWRFPYLVKYPHQAWRRPVVVVVHGS